ncbi:RNA polymerase sigma factor [Bacillus sp. SD088]|uniref:RNA polymerase sigma factor n=1 Tax=Bacillus sp. SD088 TaxID=2782012 RepID=UPI001A9695E5|nr:sigma-70 family RNA polymerase sigma factor [Bacillus sp. SD088]MBO0991705.1 sigma-70 family RNA polymerase sigma factor [Bacillus sp. SD088]
MQELEKQYTEIQPKIFAFFYIKVQNQSIAEELTQDVFYQAVKGFHSFSGKSTLKTWIFSIANNRLKTYYRSKKYARSLNDKITNQTVQHQTSPEEWMIHKEEHQRLQTYLKELSPAIREIMILRLYGELSFKEIGELVSQSENYVRLAFHRAKIKLKNEMREFDG